VRIPSDDSIPIEPSTAYAGRMTGDADIAAGAALLADPARAAMLDALMDGSSRPASELASAAGIARSTASFHLKQLVEAGLLTVHAHGRYRSFRLTGPEVARAIEAVSLISPPRPVRSLRQANKGDALRLARTCYDHLAGVVGVAITDRLLSEAWLLPAGDAAYELSPAGAERLGALGVALPDPRVRRAFARPCLDWTERRPHLAGAVGAALATALVDRGWLRRRTDSRALDLTSAGRAGLRTELGLELA
jgi:DNA-binding transcriptional ArsR family regulator